MIERELRPMQAVPDAATAVDQLIALYDGATSALRDALERYLEGGAPPDAAERLAFRYPELRVTYQPDGPLPRLRRATAKLQAAGTYATTVTHPAFFRDYLLRQLEPLAADYGIALEVGLSAQGSPIPTCWKPGSIRREGRRGGGARDLFSRAPALRRRRRDRGWDLRHSGG